MKKMKFLSTILLAVMTMSTMVSCSGGDDDGGGVSYTESEVVELLTGSWVVSGELKYSEGDKRMEGTYTGTLEFRSNQYFTSQIFTNCTRNDFHTEGQDDNSEMQSRIIYNFMRTFQNYEIARKDGKIHLVFSSTDKYYFEVVSLTKNTLKLVLNQDRSDYYGDVWGHVYMTVVSK